MMRTHSSHILHKQSNTPVYSLYNHNKLSEQDTIDISYLFLTSGIHFIKVPSIEQGRLFMDKYLSTLKCYQNIAYLGTFPFPDDFCEGNIYTELAAFRQKKQSGDLKEFMCLYMYYDFLWIEKTADLIEMEWFCDFEQGIIDFQFEKHMPIIVLSYCRD